jgi:lipopolysaccharide/colanic/teichoic acid biosynthesis glycosyltransferase
MSEPLFSGFLSRERRRANRSNQPLALLVISAEDGPQASFFSRWAEVVDALAAAKRQSDVVGWLEEDGALGLLLADASVTGSTLARDIAVRVRAELAKRLGTEAALRFAISLHVEPDTVELDPSSPIDELRRRFDSEKKRRTTYDVAKKTLDFVGSLTLLVALSPLLLLIAILVRLTSRGPVFYRQDRVGQMMKPFTMLKFRTMYANADHQIHHEFVSSFIKSSSRTTDAGTEQFFKIIDDPRVTPIGRILRKTSLDELPQLWNVLRGDMSLVGPRPPLRYEIVQYQPWHHRRVLEAKPGMTGLWQVAGRSRTSFDDMVRLDLQYARHRSLLTDLKILLATPGAVISGKGAC